MLTFQRFVRESNLDGIMAPQQVDIIDTTLGDAIEEGKVIEQEVIEMENADQLIEKMEQVASNNAQNIANVEGQPVPENITDSNGQPVAPVQPVQPEQQPQPQLSPTSTPAQVQQAVVDTVAAVESFTAGTLKVKFNDLLAGLGIYSNVSVESALRADPLTSMKVVQEALGDVIKGAWRKVVEFFKRIYEKIRSFLAKFLPFLRNNREKGAALLKKFKDIKRPVLKHDDEEFEPSDRFLVVVEAIGINRVNDMKEASMTVMNEVGALITAIANDKSGNMNADNSFSKLTSNPKIKASSLLSNLSKVNGHLVACSNSNLRFELDEVTMGTISDTLTFAGIILDTSRIYSGDEDYNHAKRYKAHCMTIHIEKKDKAKFKKTAREFKDIGIALAEVVEKSGRYEEDLKQAEKALKKIYELFEKKETQNGTKDENGLRAQILQAGKALMTSVMAATSYPTLLLKVANECMSRITDAGE